MDRPLNPDEAALWQRVVETVRPVAGRSTRPAPVPALSVPRVRRPVATGLPTVVPARKPSPGVTLDGSWDRLLARGAVLPDRTIDLHGDTLDRAYGRVDAALAAAEAAGERVLLLITGKPRPRADGRGAIRAVVGDWLAASRHAGRIAAVRPAHPRHGGAGALYVILRRR